MWVCTLDFFLIRSEMDTSCFFSCCLAFNYLDLRRTSTPRTFVHILKHWDWMFGMYLCLARKGVGPKVFHGFLFKLHNVDMRRNGMHVLDMLLILRPPRFVMEAEHASFQNVSPLPRVHFQLPGLTAGL